MADAARLVGAVSDNWATNVLLARVRIDTLPVGERGSRLHDFVRDERGPADPPTLSEGCAAGPRRPVPRPPDPSLVLDWVSLGVDLSMVGSAFGLDPLAHQEPDRGRAALEQDRHVRRSARGRGPGGGGRSAHGLCGDGTWPADGEDLRDDVLTALRGLGKAILTSQRAGA